MSTRLSFVKPIIWLTLITCLLLLTSTHLKAANYKFCVSTHDLLNYSSVITLRDCSGISGRDYKETSLKDFVKIRLTKKRSGDSYETASERFHAEIKRLTDEFKVYGLDVERIYKIVENDSQLSALKKTAPGKKVVKKNNIGLNENDIQEIIELILSGKPKFYSEAELMEEKLRKKGWSDFDNNIIVRDQIKRQKFDQIALAFKPECEKRMLGFVGFEVGTRDYYNCIKGKFFESNSIEIDMKADTKKIVKTPKKKEAKSVVVSSAIDKSLLTIGSGSGFFVNNNGFAITNNHVVEICKQVVTIFNGQEILFNVITADETNDLAIIKSDIRSRDYLKISDDGALLGENIFAVGYPLSGTLSDSVKVTRGIVSSLSGIKNNIGQIQIDAALQPGNSGGPVINEKGVIVGVASAGLNKLKMAKEADYIPENVNFAVASNVLTRILELNQIKYSKEPMFASEQSSTDIAEMGNKSTIHLLCRNTRLAYYNARNNAKYRNILLDINP